MASGLQFEITQIAIDFLEFTNHLIIERKVVILKCYRGLLTVIFQSLITSTSNCLGMKLLDVSSCPFLLGSGVVAIYSGRGD